MVKRLILCVLLAAFVSSASEAVTLRRGKKGRKYLRRFSLVENLENDKAWVHEKYGYPYHRLRFREYGTRREVWTYYEQGLEFQLDIDSNLIKVRHIMPEDRRERIERYPARPLRSRY
jgi:hypothetical protein